MGEECHHSRKEGGGLEKRKKTIQNHRTIHRKNQFQKKIILIQSNMMKK